jgi:hypothetical protein
LLLDNVTHDPMENITLTRCAVSPARRPKVLSCTPLPALQNQLGWAELREPACPHHGDVRGHLRNHRQAVRNQNVGEPQFALQILQQQKHLRAHGNVQRGDRFIRDHQSRLQDQGPRNADALPLAAGKFVRVPLNRLCFQPHPRQHRGRLCFALRARRPGLVNRQRLRHDLANAHPGVQRGEASYVRISDSF